jgi:hypothetical protein
MHLAHPLRTRAIAAARVKTDAVDAKTSGAFRPPLARLQSRLSGFQQQARDEASMRAEASKTLPYQ